MSSDDRAEVSVKDRVAVIALKRPPVNAIDHPMLDALHGAMRATDADPDIRAVILTSALPRMFCGGMDLRMVAEGDVHDFRAFVYRFYMDTMNIQYAMRKPTIVALNGPARGAGMTLAITSDVILAADDVDVGYPEIDVSVLPAIHYVHLPRQISRHKAFELLFGGKPFPAQEAVSLGIINHAVPRSELMERAFSLAYAFAAKSQRTMELPRLLAGDLDVPLASREE